MKSFKVKNIALAMAVIASSLSNSSWASSQDGPYTAEEMLQRTTVNLMWVHKIQFDRDLVVPEVIGRYSKEKSKTVDIDLYAQVNAWAAHYPVVLWYDSHMLKQHEQAVINTRTLVDKECPYKDRIQLRDLRSLESVQQYARVFNSDQSVYRRVDLLRILAARETLKTSAPGSFFVYTDFTIPVLEPKALMSEETVGQLNTYGIVMAKAASTMSVYENSFQITGNHNPNLLKAMDAILISKSVDAMSDKPWIVNATDSVAPTYTLYPQFFEVFYAIDGKATYVRDEEPLTSENLDRVSCWTSGNAYTCDRLGNFTPLEAIQVPEGVKNDYAKQFNLGYKWGLYIPIKDVQAPGSNHAL